MSKKKKNKPLYDSNGNWIEERNRIKGAIRRAYRVHPSPRQCLKDARVELPPKRLIDGSIGKKNQIRYRCAGCNELFSQKFVQVDHIDPVCPVWLHDVDMSYDMMVRRIFCKLDNLQVLCSTPMKLLPKGKSSCHKIKSLKEIFLRKKWTELALRDKLPKIPFKLNQYYTVLNLEDIKYIDSKNKKFLKEYDLEKINV